MATPASTSSRVPADYFVLYTNIAQRQQIPGPLRLAMQTAGPEFTAYIQGVPYVWVYRLLSPSGRGLLGRDGLGAEPQ